MVADDKKRVTLTLSRENLKKMEEIARKAGLSKSALITMWINASKNK